MGQEHAWPQAAAHCPAGHRLHSAGMAHTSTLKECLAVTMATFFFFFLTLLLSSCVSPLRASSRASSRGRSAPKVAAATPHSAWPRPGAVRRGVPPCCWGCKHGAEGPGPCFLNWECLQHPQPQGTAANCPSLGPFPPHASLSAGDEEAQGASKNQTEVMEHPPAGRGHCLPPRLTSKPPCRQQCRSSSPTAPSALLLQAGESSSPSPAPTCSLL